MVTRPKEMVPDAMARAVMTVLPPGSKGSMITPAQFCVQNRGTGGLPENRDSPYFPKKRDCPCFFYHPRMPHERKSGRDLAGYRAKRDPGRTPEPFGEAVESQGPLRFVVQQHAARRLHWDLRLEWEGVLLSWAVPKGPSYDTADKQLAVQTEDHPLEYSDFEGVIPKGEYGGGAMIVWDHGRWTPLEDPAAGLEKGKLLFDLHGYKLRGRWTLVKMKKTQRDWLLIKERDEWAQAGGREVPPESVFSGLTVEELARASEAAERLRTKLAASGAPRRAVDAAKTRPMLAETAENPFSRKGWLYELKYDGYRVLASRQAEEESGRARAELRYRSGLDASHLFPEIARAVRSLPVQGLLIDGEVVVLDETGKPSFQRLQKRAQLHRSGDIARGAVEHPATYFVFDLLAGEGFDLRSLPLAQRKALLAEILPPAGPVRYADHVEERGEELYRAVREAGAEGVVGKHADSAYVTGRSDKWLKVRAEQEEDFVVVGYTLPKGLRSGLGALHLAAYDDGGRLVYAGRAGTGFTAQSAEETAAKLDKYRRGSPPCEGPMPKGKEHVWVEPKYVAVVRYLERTDEGQLRHPVFVRLRTDKKPEECLLPPEKESPKAARRPRVEEPSARNGGSNRVVRFSNLSKIFWPDEGYTKGDLIEYYRAISPWLLPYLRDRPLVMTRYPDGIRGKNFFQKDAPLGTPEWVRTESIWSEDTQRDIDYFICNDLETLLHLANLATIPLHLWASRLESIDRPDWSILDLDPKGAPFTQVVEVAIAAKVLCDDIGMPCFAKTSGSSGMHVLLPLGGQCSFEQAKQLAEVMARVLVAELPKLATVERVISERGGKIYVDFLQNGHGKLLVSPFCVRPVEGARVSMPLRWSEVTAKLDPKQFTIRTAVARMEKLGEDPLRPVVTTQPKLAAVLAKLARRSAK
jgi:bifunctional non-homologous end joining protein LigD